MVELRFNVSDVDFDSVIQALSGRLAGPVTMMARTLPDSAKEELVVKYINANADRLESWACAWARRTRPPAGWRGGWKTPWLPKAFT